MRHDLGGSEIRRYFLLPSEREIVETWSPEEQAAVDETLWNTYRGASVRLRFALENTAEALTGALPHWMRRVFDKLAAIR